MRSAARHAMFQPEFPQAPPPVPPPASPPARPVIFPPGRYVITPEYWRNLSYTQRARMVDDPNFVIQAHAGVQVDSPIAMRHTVDALKDICREWGMSSSGIKENLVKRVEHEAIRRA